MGEEDKLAERLQKNSSGRKNSVLNLSHDLGRQGHMGQFVASSGMSYRIGFLLTAEVVALVRPNVVFDGGARGAFRSRERASR